MSDATVLAISTCLTMAAGFLWQDYVARRDRTWSRNDQAKARKILETKIDDNTEISNGLVAQGQAIEKQTNGNLSRMTEKLEQALSKIAAMEARERRVRAGDVRP